MTLLIATIRINELLVQNMMNSLLTFTGSKLTIKTLEKGMKYVHS